MIGGSVVGVLGVDCGSFWTAFKLRSGADVSLLVSSGCFRLLMDRPPLIETLNLPMIDLQVIIDGL